MTTVFYAGSFDPFTIGHLDVVSKSAKMFEKVIVGIATNPEKTRHYKAWEMKEAMKKTFAREGLNNVEVIVYNMLTAEVAKEAGANLMIRGIRNSMDYAYEENLASINEELSGIDTIYIRAGKMSHISSSMVRELIRCPFHSEATMTVAKYLPKDVYELVMHKK